MLRCRYLLVLFFLQIAAIKTEEPKCESTEKCLCINYKNSGYFEYQCPRNYEENGTIITVIHAEKTVKIDCDKTDILDGNFLPDADFPDITVVDIRKCPIPKNGFGEIARSFRVRRLEKLIFKMQTSNETLKPEHFRGLEDLKILELTQNRMKFLNASIFKNVPNLTKLYLDNNNVQLTDGIFENCRNLRYLSLMYNGIRKIPEKMFENLTHLTRLNLWRNEIEHVDGRVFAPLNKLEFLELSLNKLRNFRDADIFRHLINMRNVTLRRNELRVISRKTFEANRNLERVDLHENSNLTLLDGVFSDFPRLSVVNLSRNNMRNVTPDLFRNSGNLVMISLQYNRFEELPANLFDNLTQLKRLDLSNNELKRLDPLDLESLEFLNLENNDLDVVDENLLRKLQSLKEINLSFNKIAKIHRFSLSRNYNLVKFFMRSNRFDFDGALVFSPFLSPATLNLEQIDLSFNRITRYPYELHEIIAMKDMDLEHNQINEIILERLRTLNPKGVVVNLKFNNISLVKFPEYFYDTGVSKNPPKTTLKLGGNPINCDCRVLGFTNFIRDISHPDTIFLDVKHDGLECYDPGNMRGIRLIDVDVEKLRCDLGYRCTENQTCDCSFRSIDKSLIIDCSRRNLRVIPVLTLGNVENFEFNQTEVHLELNNYLERMPSEYDGYSNVTKLFMRGNRIGNITWLPPSIKVLDLRNNSFETLNNASLKLLYGADADELHLGYNPWKCNGGSEHIVAFLRSHENEVDMLDIKCNATGRRMIEMQKYEFYPQKKNHLALYAITALTCLFILTVLFTIYYKFQENILVWLYANGWLRGIIDEEKLDKDKIYDAFISFSHVDEDFVYEKLVPELESGDQPYKLCIHIRDWTVGEFITTSIVKSVNLSRKTIVVLSSNFLKSDWAMMEFRAAHIEAMRERRARVIMIIYGDLNIDELDDELKLYINTYTYIKWTEGDSKFWDKLKYALPKRKPQKGGKFSRKHANMMDFIDGKFNVIGKQAAVNPPKIVLDPDKNIEEKSLTCIA